MGKSTTKPGDRRNTRKRPEPIGEGWRTTDADEIERRRRRAREEKLRAAAVGEGTFAVSSGSGRSYRVELRAHEERVNSCDCPDYEANGLGTCKHIEAVLAAAGAEPPRRRSEVFLDRTTQYAGGPRVRVLWADKLRANSRVRRALDPYFDADGVLLADPVDGVPALRRSIAEAGLGEDAVRVSRHIEVWVTRLRQEKERRAARSRFLADVAAGKRELNVVRFPLYEYQREGMLHLAFRERAILADEMGLGKTVQAVAACELLRRLRGIQRVLVISPVSLKTEWEEQIGKFTDLPTRIIQGPRGERLRQYREDGFFYLANYEQVLSDGEPMQELLAPDVIVLDEAQRIKNWQSKTADAVKRLRSRYVFVLTGTPLENRIDEIYSIAQVVDPHLFGPLFRFNRDFYELDDKGRPAGYKHLGELHRRLRPVLLRRRKDEVEGELPGRTVNTYFVEMDPQQREYYEDYNATVARLANAARRRPLRPEEFQRLQSALACMRMVCDTPYIVDQGCRVSPKLEEFKAVLEEQLADRANKLIVFSEWTRMLELVREHLDALGVGYAWHTGEVPQGKRREAINRFKEDPACRLFLSSDAGATGLNLQAANVVVNLDLPWNPAKLEQRIARAWRKHQQRPVSVINLVCQDSIEHRILHLLEQKRSLAAGVLDGEGGERMELPSARRILIDRLGELMDAPEPTAAEPREPEPQQLSLALDDLPQELEARHPRALDRMELYQDELGRRTLFAVMDRPERSGELHGLLQRCGETDVAAEVVDRATMETIERLIDAGVLRPARAERALYRSERAGEREREVRRARLGQARGRLKLAEHSRRMAEVLGAGGFDAESAAPLAEALEQGLAALQLALDGEVQEPVTLACLRETLLPTVELDADVAVALAGLREGGPPPREWRESVAVVLERIGERIGRWEMEA